ncbi:MAG: hypothetical protein LBS40_04960 [Burkholderiales bacterium]|jgi:folate-binding protein YgfZ|nr:hypothetical protein [Burkholderiales bacterium]
MTKTQLSFLAERGGRIVRAPNGAEIVADFGNYAAECDAFEHTVCLCDATGCGLLRISGNDAATFLHGQLSTHVNALPVGRGGYTTYNTAKGRMLASLFLWRAEDGFYALLSDDLVETIKNRLSMYVLRAKVVIEDVSAQYAYLGLCGVTANETVCRMGIALTDGDVVQKQATMIMLSTNRVLILAALQRLRETWALFAPNAQPSGRNLWQRAAILAAIPTITAPTSEKLIPQAANWDALGGVDFNKGCYVGQEIIARTRYLGHVKERLYLARCDYEELFAAGTPVYSSVFGEQACGIVVNAAPDRTGQVMLVAMRTVAKSDTVHAQSTDGETLTLLTLPYGLDS